MSNPEQVNSKAIVVLTLGVLSILIPLIGLVLGVVGIVIAKQTIEEVGSESGLNRGLAISGLICGIVGIALHVLFGVFYLMFILLIGISFI